LATFPEQALAAINRALVWLGDMVLGPVLGLPPLASLLIVSIATSAAIVPVIGRTSDQPRVAATKRRIRAALLEIRLFHDDPRLVMRAVGHALAQNLLYLRLSLVPLAWLAIPLTLLVTHLQPFYGYSGLQTGVPSLIKVALRDSSSMDAAARATIEGPAAIRIDAGPVRLVGSNDVLWRLVPGAPGDYALSVRIGSDSVTKTLRVADGPGRRSPRRPSPGLVDQLLYPSEPPIESASSIASIDVPYPETTVNVLGFHVHWTIVYLVLSMAAALILARRFGITV
jgi:hypothetical protein